MIEWINNHASIITAFATVGILINAITTYWFYRSLEKPNIRIFLYLLRAEKQSGRNYEIKFLINNIDRIPVRFHSFYNTISKLEIADCMIKNKIINGIESHEIGTGNFRENNKKLTECEDEDIDNNIKELFDGIVKNKHAVYFKDISGKKWYVNTIEDASHKQQSS